jgi:hypothetical protein
MRKFLSYAVLVVLVALIPRTVGAQSSKPSILLGQDHKYGVHLRSNGEAIVTSKVVFTNRSDKEQKSLTLGISGSVYELYALQQILPSECRQYSSYSNDKQDQRTCIKSVEPDYRQQYYGYYGNEVDYRQSNYSNNGNDYVFTLPNPVGAGKSGSIIISFASKSYTQTKFGNTTFDFETLKANERIQDLSVSVSFDDDIYFDGKKSKVQYAPESSSGISSLADGANANSNESLQNYVGNIGNSGVIVKKASNLAPGDTYRVKGSYATSWLALNFAKIVWVSLGLLLLIGIIFFITNRRRKPKVNAKLADQVVKDDDTQVSLQAMNASYNSAKNNKNEQHYVKIFKFKVTLVFGSFLYALISILQSGIAAALIAFVLSIALHENNGYQVSTIESFIQILGVIAGVLTLLLGLFILPILLARRKGLRYLFITVAFEVMWILIILLVLSIFVSSNPEPRYNDYNYPSPMLDIIQ